MDRPFFLGVAGGSGSGKTTVARAILAAVGAEQIAFLEQDSYYRDIEWGPGHDPGVPQLRPPDALDHELLVHHLRELEAGRPIECPVYDFTVHRRTAETLPSRPARSSSSKGSTCSPSPASAPCSTSRSTSTRTRTCG